MSEQATAEARAEAERLVSLEMDGKCQHMYGSYHMSDCADCIAEAIDRVAGEREREALERAAVIARAHQHSIDAFDPPERVALATYSNGTCELIARAIRALVGSVDRAEAGEGK